MAKAKKPKLQLDDTKSKLPTPRQTEVEALSEVAGPALIQRLRLLVQPPGKKGSWLRDLSDRRLTEVYFRLKRGEPVHKIAKIAQIDWGLMRKSNTKSISRALRDLRDKVIDDITKAAAAHQLKEPEKRSLSLMAERIIKKIDGLGMQRWLIMVQQERIADLRKAEAESGEMYKMTGKEIARLSDMITQYFDNAIRLGVIDEKPSETNLNIKIGFERIMGSLPDDGARLLTMTSRFLELAEKESVTLTQKGDGTFSSEEEAHVTGQDAADSQGA